MYINVDKTSLKAVTIGPEATAGSIRNLAKKKGESVPSKVAIKQAPNKPVPTINPKRTGLDAV